MLAPFFNKHNLTPRVNSFFGFEGAGKARDDYMKRMIMDRDGAFEDPLRERAMPVEKLVGLLLNVCMQAKQARRNYACVLWVCSLTSASFFPSGK